MSLKKAFEATLVGGIPEITAQQLKDCASKVLIIDVRQPSEFVGELGHIAGATLVTLGEELNRFLQGHERSAEIVFVCRSGGRSAAATEQSLSLGYSRVANLQGGMIEWNRLGFEVRR